MRTTEPPKVTKDDSKSSGSDATVSTHPCYGQIGASRVSGGTYLYGSDYKHREYIQLRVSRSVMSRDISHDWPHARQEIVEVAMSEAQWAHLVSSLNVGEGALCTITAINNIQVPQLPEPAVTKDDQFEAEVLHRLTIVDDSLRELGESLAAVTMSTKSRDKLRDLLDTARRNLTPNLSYVAKCFGEHVERRVEQAKGEVAAHINNVVTRLGLSRLRGEDAPQSPIELPPTNDKP